MKLRDLIYSSFRLIQVTEQGEYDVSTSMENEAIAALQSLVASWSTRHFLLPSTIIEEFSLQSGKKSYTIGEGGDFDTPAPEHITAMYTTCAGFSDTLVTPISQEDYFATSRKDIESSSGPASFYYHFSYPLAVLYLFPVPGGTMKLTIASYKNYQWLDIASLDMVIPLPTPYLNALKYNLALELAAEYATQVPAAVVRMAKQTLLNIAKFSLKPVPYTKFDFGTSPYWVRSSW